MSKFKASRFVNSRTYLAHGTMKSNQFTVFLTICLALSAAISGFVSKPGAIPSEMVGKWKWGTIKPVWFHDRATGEYKGHGGGVSAFFDFDKSGRFKHYTYIETNANGWKTQVFTTMEGTVAVEGETFRLHVEKGTYKSRSNMVKKHNYDRDMTNQERKDQSKRAYKWAAAYGEGGTRSLEITLGGQVNPTVFTPAN